MLGTPDREPIQLYQGAADEPCQAAVVPVRLAACRAAAPARAVRQPTAVTRNHFALDLGVDRRDLLGALDAFTGGAACPYLLPASGRLPLSAVPAAQAIQKG